MLCFRDFPTGDNYNLQKYLTSTKRTSLSQSPAGRRKPHHRRKTAIFAAAPPLVRPFARLRFRQTLSYPTWHRANSSCPASSVHSVLTFCNPSKESHALSSGNLRGDVFGNLFASPLQPRFGLFRALHTTTRT